MPKILRRTFAHYFAHLAIFGAAFAIYSLHDYYLDFLSAPALVAFKTLFFGYCALGLPYYFLRFRFFCSEKEYSADKLVVLRNFIFRQNLRTPELKKSARTAALSYLVKFFFLPLMLNFFFLHSANVLDFWRTSFERGLFRNFWQSGYHLIFQSIFVVDTFVFACGYAFEFRFLKNKIKSVDPFVSGWVVALICYPPFSGALDNFIPLTKNFTLFQNALVLDILKIGILVAFTIYVWATLALGTKASNLTNRGIVSRGPYRFVRHPAYISKNLAWWFEFLPFLNFATFAALLAWNAIYILRALTEERHLRADPEYQKYCQKVRWKFIPGII